MSDSKRSHETRIELDVPLDQVWKAITEANELARWFAPKMTVEPGVGGHITADWGPGLEWRTEIEVWEPGRHLRLVETRDRILSAAPEQLALEPCRLVQDFFLETENGKTVLRLVHSGFGSSADWDAEYEGTRGGWAGCFARLKEGLERHPGESVHNRIFHVLCRQMSPDEVLTAVEAAAPQPWNVTMRQDLHLCGLLPERNNSIVNVSVQPTPNGTMTYAELLLYGLRSGEIDAVETQWKGVLDRLVR